ncbi:hypothetical protein WICANDRAFT_60552 [Wickerhamomyces anomalus NRRL Y-366-8]|uniref:Transcription and mRNA export factor SUS1 n=1 Tax=Wickerhamomyces anomalus (strain ATCC 58044 / CBS 1984 / NCYC 433 / NRRL Y-366-8) TaxID=683960 RepID=A0A1E3PAQ1_WICAA|nr:uncharacterized protein WICANDRAFT_60552 [Wickerhamomyces anomalus NRRL Y-366-8]ODQ62496.1 hypothetical protein WICANDRAFT_60552 [Wickerhamomyces anomalus NRRL Y-366-8]
MANETDLLKAKIQERLIESGEYDRISTALKQKLAESGWYDNIKSIANDQISHEDSLNFSRLNQQLEPKALEMVPESVKNDTLLQIKQFLETVVEKEI